MSEVQPHGATLGASGGTMGPSQKNSSCLLHISTPLPGLCPPPGRTLPPLSTWYTLILQTSSGGSSWERLSLTSPPIMWMDPSPTAPPEQWGAELTQHLSFPRLASPGQEPAHGRSYLGEDLVHVSSS